MYSDLAPWFHLLTHPSDYGDEAAFVSRVVDDVAIGDARTLLELGSGGGNNASHLKTRFDCTLTDISPEMLALSRALNPECEHLPGDMRTLRLGRTFDAVLVHDAVAYMTTRADLAATAATAFAHTRPGGAAVFAPDYVRESFSERSELHGGDDGGRSLRCIEWVWDPDPADDTYTVEYAFLLRDASGVRAVHDRHVEGLFARATWIEILTGAGYQVQLVDRPFDDTTTDAIFLCRRP
jgi:SAM-dependent methyltransferase